MARKLLLTAAAAIAALGMASAASATIYTYSLTNGTVVTLNSVSGQGTLVNTTAPNIANLSFTGNFSGITGQGSLPTIMLTSISGTRVVNGVTYTPNMTTGASGMGPALEDGYLWANYTNAAGQSLAYGGNSTDYNFPGAWTITTCVPAAANNQCGTGPSTTTGGNTTPGGNTTTGGNTTGGTAVPEPANELALFGLGVLALAIGRRDMKRRAAKA